MKRRLKKSILVIILFFAAAGGAVGFLIYNAIPKGKLTLDSTLSKDQVKTIESIFGKDGKDLSIHKDMKISAKEVDNLSSNEIVFDIQVPVTSFYSSETKLDSSLAQKTEESSEKQVNEPTFISLSELDNTKKLLSYNNSYYLDDFTSGARFQIITVESDNADEKTSAENKIREKMPVFPRGKDEILTINQTGVTALTRGMGKKLDEVGNAEYFTENIRGLLEQSDLTHISNEVSFADDCKVDSGSTVLCADNRMFDAIKAIGTDIIELTGNHNVDVGKAAAIDTLNLYRENGLQTFGGGENAEDAKKPLEIDQKNTKITWLGYNLSTTKPGAGGATDELPGANIYDEEVVTEQIKTAKENGNFVIVDLQYFECYCYPEEGFVEHPTCDLPIHPGESGWPDQEEFFKHLIDLGADLVVGTQAHQPQTYQIYKGKAIYYGLGNLFFDQTYWPGTERSLILTHYFYNGKLLQTKITPTIYDESLQTAAMNEDDAKTFLNRLGKYYKDNSEE